VATKRILFISLSNIGDAVLTTPVLEALHEIYPSALIDIVSDSRSCVIYESCPYRGKVYLKNKSGLFRGTISLLRELRKNYYDLIVDLRTDGLVFLLRGKNKLTKRDTVLCGAHAVEQHMAVIDKINKNKLMPHTNIWLDISHKEFAKKQLQKLDGENIIAVSPGCHVPMKAWSPKNYAAACNAVIKNIDAVIVIGGSGDKEYADRMVTHLNVPYQNLTGKTGLLEAAAILQLTKLFIGNDSGLGHIASSLSVPSVTLFGGGNPQRYRPWGPQAVWLQGKNNDINSIMVDDVSGLMLKQLAN